MPGAGCQAPRAPRVRIAYPCDSIQLGVAMTQVADSASTGRTPVNDAPYTVALFVDPSTGKRVRRRITTALSRLPFETAAPIRCFPAYRGRRAHQGRYWFSRSQSRVNFESLFERTALRVLDFRGDIVRVSSNPFWLLWAKDSGPKRHAPDFFARCADGSVLVVDVKPEHRITDDDRIQHARTREVCSELGWKYEEFITMDPIMDRNLRLLAGYNRPQFAFDAAGTRAVMTALSAAEDRRPRLADLLDAVCASTGIDDATALCGIYHMVWFGQLHVDLVHPLMWDCEVQQ